MVQFYKFIHTFSLFCQTEKVYKAKEKQIYPFSIRSTLLHPTHSLSQKSRTAVRPGFSQYRLLEIFEGKVWSRDIDGGELLLLY